MSLTRTKIELTVLSEEGLPPNIDLKTIVEQGTDGDYVIAWKTHTVDELSPEQMGVALTEAGSDPGFFDLIPIPPAV